MFNLLRDIDRWFAYRRTRRRWRDIKTLLVIVLIFVLCNIAGLACGVTGYTLQRLGLLPTATPIP